MADDDFAHAAPDQKLAYPPMHEHPAAIPPNIRQAVMPLLNPDQPAPRAAITIPPEIANALRDTGTR